MRKECDSFSPKEILVLINNAVAVSLKPDRVKITDARLRRLKAFANALIYPLQELVNGGLDEDTKKPFAPCLRAEELVTILCASALYVQAALVLETDRVPQARISDLLFKKMI